MDVLRITFKSYSARRYCGEQSAVVLHQGDARDAVDELFYQLEGTAHREGDQLFPRDRFSLVAVERIVSVEWATTPALADLADLQPLKESRGTKDRKVS